MTYTALACFNLFSLLFQTTKAILYMILHRQLGLPLCFVVTGRYPDAADPENGLQEQAGTEGHNTSFGDGTIRWIWWAWWAHEMGPVGDVFATGTGIPALMAVSGQSRRCRS